MLGQMTPQQFSERMAADVLDPIDATWEQSGTIAATVHNEITRVLGSFSKDEPTASDFHTSAEYMPLIRVEDEDDQKTEPATDDELRAVVESAQAIAGF